MSLLNKASLIQIPSGYKDGTLYSAKPTNGDGDFTFSRGSNLAATRVNSEGLIEKGRENLFTYSNDFSQSVWVKLGAGAGSAAVVTSGFTDPNGGSNAWRLQCDLNGGTTSSDQSLIYQGGSLTGVFAFSYYVKSNTGSSQDFAFGNGLAGYENGTATTEWQRFTAFFNCPTNNNAFIGTRGTMGTDDTLDILIYAAQLEVGLVSTPYIETGASTAQAGILEDMPRLDYSGGASCGHLLLEPQRSNLVTQSEYFNDSSWSSYVFGGASLTKTFGYTSPEGVDNAYKLDVVVGTGGVLFTHNFTATASVDHTLSIWMKGEVGGEKVQIDLKNTSSNGITGSLLTLTNEWKRYDLTLTNDTGTSRGFQFRMQQSSGLSDQTIYVYGAMAESSASYPSSYIPTYGASVTRGEDVCVNGGDSSSFNDSQGVFFFEGSTLVEAGETRVVSISDGSTSNNIYMNFNNNANSFNCEVISSGSSQFNTSVTMTKLNNNKIAIKYKENDFALWINGVEVATDTSGSTPTGLDRFNFDFGQGSFDFKGNVKKALYFNTALTDDELAALTTI